jgi:chromosome segregation ATPase
MLTKLILRGFQVHKSLEIDLEQITVLTGPNDAGKSAVLRALQWIACNIWNGAANEFINWDMESCEVELHVENHIVTKTKSKSDYVYSLDGHEYRAFHPKVPDAIATVLNISPDSIQEQDDPAFWLTLTSGQAASALNEIFNLSAIDDSLSNVASELRKVKSKHQVSEERLQKFRSDKKELKWIVEADRDLKELEEIERKLEDNKMLEREVLKRMLLLKEIKELEEISEWVAERARMVNLLAEKIRQLEADELVGSKVLALSDEIEKQSKLLADKEAKLAKLLADKCPLCGRGDK